MIKYIKYHIFGHMDYFFQHEKVADYIISYFSNFEQKKVIIISNSI